MPNQEKYGIVTECGHFGDLNLKDDPSFIEVEEEQDIEKIKKEAIEANKSLIK